MGTCLSCVFGNNYCNFRLLFKKESFFKGKTDRLDDSICALPPGRINYSFYVSRRRISFRVGILSFDSFIFTLSVTGMFLFSYTPASVEDTGSKRKITFSILCAVVIATAVFLLIDIGNVQKVKEFIPYFVVLFVSLISGGFLLTSFFDRKKGSNKIGDIYAVLSLLLILIAYICFFTVCIVWENNYRLIGNIGSYNVVGMLILAVLVFADRKNASKCFLFSSVAILNLVVLIMLIFIPCSADSALYDVLRVVKNNSDVLLVNIAISVSYMIWHLIRILLTKQRTVS